MRIAYVCMDPGISLSGASGSSTHVREMIGAFEDLGHDVVLFCSNLGGTEKKLDCRNIVPILWDRHAHASPRTSLNDHAKRRLNEVERLKLNFTLAKFLGMHCKEEQIDLVYERYSLFHFAGLQAARSFAVPHLLEVNAPLCHEEKYMRGGLELSGLAQAIERNLFNNTDHVLAVSEELRAFVVGVGVNPNQVSVVPNGVTRKIFGHHSTDCDGVKRSLGLNEKTLVGFVGSLKRWHGTALLIDAFAELARIESRLHLLIVGNGPQFTMIESQINSLGLHDRVTLMGAVPHEEIPQLISAMDIAVAPYDKSDFFYFSPMKIFEYLGAGVAVVAAEIGQIASLIIDGETGLLVEPGNVSALRDSILKLLHDSELRKRIGTAGRAWVLRERTWEINAKLAVEIAIASQRG